jgi:hypothetical protein
MVTKNQMVAGRKDGLGTEGSTTEGPGNRRAVTGKSGHWPRNRRVRLYTYYIYSMAKEPRVLPFDTILYYILYRRTATGTVPSNVKKNHWKFVPLSIVLTVLINKYDFIS